jgi:beta-galactosidase
VKQTVRIALPENWENNWHYVVANYDGSAIYLTIDDKESEHKFISGNIRNTPFPVNIGRNAEVHGQETSVYICDAIIDQVGIFSKQISSDFLKNPTEGIKQQADLWLDFEEETKGGEFYSYGIGARTYGSIWPDRRPQPEMWQIKKSAQPVSVKLVSAESGLVEITNRYLFTDLRDIDARWALQRDGEVLQKGNLDLNLSPGKKAVLNVPFVKPEIKNGSVYFLLVSFHQKERTLWADPGFEIAWDQMELPWFKPLSVAHSGIGQPVAVEEAGENLLIKGKNFTYRFDKKRGFLESMKVNGRELIIQGAELNIWRAPLANETDEWTFRSSNIKNRTDGYGRMAATEWYSAGIDKMSFLNDNFSWEKPGDTIVVVNSKNIYSTGNKRGSFINLSKYIIDGNGILTLENSIVPNGQMPSWLPRIGQQWILDSTLRNVNWSGRGPQENYPDRKSGYRVGEYQTTVEEMYEPYLIPQDYGLRTDTRRVRITGKDGSGLEFRGSKLFNFSAQPYSTDNLTKALYTYQLHPFDGITFNLDYATSGVGCTAAGVFPEYQVMPQRYDFVTTISPILK